MGLPALVGFSANLTLGLVKGVDVVVVAEAETSELEGLLLVLRESADATPLEMEGGLDLLAGFAGVDSNRTSMAERASQR